MWCRSPPRQMTFQAPSLCPQASWVFGVRLGAVGRSFGVLGDRVSQPVCRRRIALPIPCSPPSTLTVQPQRSGVLQPALQLSTGIF